MKKIHSITMLTILIAAGYASLLIALGMIILNVYQGKLSMDASQAETRKIEEVRSGIRKLFGQKEKLLKNIMETKDRQDSVNYELLKQLPGITRVATNNEQKQKGGIFRFLKKKEKTVTTSSMLYNLNKNVVQI